MQHFHRSSTLVNALLMLALVLSNTPRVAAEEAPPPNGKGTAAGLLIDRTPRDPWLWPFSSLSIWNMPLGQRAQIEAAGHFQAPQFGYGADIEFLYKESAGDPQQPIYEPAGFINRCGGTSVQDGIQRYLRVPDNLIRNVARPGFTPNDVTTWLLADGRTVFQLQPFARCTPGGPVYGYWQPNFPTQNIYGLGIYGTHFGSGLSGFGGSLRYGELTGEAPIRHALHFQGFAHLYYYYNVADHTPGYRWPADRSDAYAGEANSPINYGGTNPKFEIGALVALPANLTPEQLGLKTAPGRKLFYALQNYGAYLTDDTAWNHYDFGVSEDAYYEFKEVYGYNFDVNANSNGAARDFYDDLVALTIRLGVVNDNGPARIGGAGPRVAPLASPFFKPMDQTAPTTPAEVAVVGTTVSSVSLRWASATDNVRVMRYEVVKAGEVVATTRGQTTVTVTGLEPETDYTFTVRAVDTGLNRSPLSTAATAHTAPGYTENFNDNAAQGWVLGTGFAAQDGTLYIDGWCCTSSAFYMAKRSTGSYSLGVNVQSYAGDGGNKTYLFFNYQDSNNTYGVEINGGPANNVVLFKLVNGARTDLGASATRVPLADGPRLIAHYDAATPSIRVDAEFGGATTTVIPVVADAAFSAGYFGIGVAYSATRFDDVSYQGELANPFAPTWPSHVTS